MTSEEITKSIVEIASDILDRRLIDVSLVTEIDTIDGWDSLAHINIVTELERHYDIRFSLADLETITTILDLNSLIVKYV
jgi:acyl carrier protein